MMKERLDENLLKLHKTYGKADFPEVTPMENTEEFLRNNGAISLDEFIAMVGKL